MTWIMVGLGAAIGGMARHAVNQLVHQRSLASTFPLGIFLINVLGSIVIGLIAGGLTTGRFHLSYHARTFIIVGVLGGFTTFSSFSLDTFALFREGRHAQAFWNVAGQMGLSLL